MSTPYDDVHAPDCEDGKYFQCPDPQCKLVPDTELNWCDFHLRFIPRITECICEELKIEYEYA